MATSHWKLFRMRTLLGAWCATGLVACGSEEARPSADTGGAAAPAAEPATQVNSELPAPAPEAPVVMAGVGSEAVNVVNRADGTSAPAAPQANAPEVPAPAPELPRTQVVPAEGASLVTPDPNVRHQTLEGWGTSLAWWAHQIGAWPEQQKNDLIELIVNPTTGLGYNIFRYNIGGGENPGHTHMGANKDLPGFQALAGTWNWDADARQTSVLKQIVARGQSVILEAFSNSPPYWMTKSGCASGNTDGSNNLRDDSYPAFADYLTEVVLHYRDVLGITFRTLEPLNEPTANWWYANGGQEGCHFDAAKQQQILSAVGAQLQAKGLNETRVSGSDDNSMDDALRNVRGYDAATLALMPQINAHSYAGSLRRELRQLATSVQKRLWQSESGPLGVQLADETDAALFMAGRIILDLRELQPEAWVDWQVVDSSRSWSSFVVDDAQHTFTPRKRFYMHAGFSRYIRPGSTFIEIDNADMVAAVSADAASTTIVARNGDTTNAKTFTFDLTRFASLGSQVQVYRTSRTEDLAPLPPVALENWSFTATLPPYSVTTYVLGAR